MKEEAEEKGKEGEEDSKSNEHLTYIYVYINFFLCCGTWHISFALCYELGGGSIDRSTLLVVDVM
jgi:hypothetical protein